MTPNESGAQDTKEYTCPACQQVTKVILINNVLRCQWCAALYALHKAEGNNQYTFRRVYPNCYGGFHDPGAAERIANHRYQLYSNIVSGALQGGITLRT